MSKTVGIPRSLFFYEYYPMWKTFFEELGAEIVISDYSTKRTLDEGVRSCIDEACLPVKLFHGHVKNIKDKVDYLFIPRFTSISRDEYICPKFGGLPDMIRHTIKDLPEIIDTEINMRKSQKNDFKAALEVGAYFCDNRKKVCEAYRNALENYKAYKNEMLNGSLPCDILDKTNVHKKQSKYGGLNIAVLGHVYNLYDSFSNMNMIQKLKNNDANVIAIDMIDENIINEKSNTLNKKIFWNFGRKAVGGALHLIERKDIDGIVYIMSFGCGVDSFICDLIERRVRRTSSIPFIVLTIDEHSGEAGMDTRLEAFIDMIKWRKRNEADVSAYG